MTDSPYTPLPQWPHAYPASGASATLKRLNEDFIVTELPLQLPSGEGEHLWLDIEKNGANTAFVAQQLAEAAGVNEWDVGYAGLKDRYAITRQWFSIHRQNRRDARPDPASAPGIQGAEPEPPREKAAPG